MPSERSKVWRFVPSPDCPKEEEAGDGSDSSDIEQIRLGVFDRYFRDEDDKGKGKGSCG